MLLGKFWAHHSPLQVARVKHCLWTHHPVLVIAETALLVQSIGCNAGTEVHCLGAACLGLDYGVLTKEWFCVLEA